MQRRQEWFVQYADNAGLLSHSTADVEHALPCRASLVSLDSFLPIADGPPAASGSSHAYRAELYRGKSGGRPVSLSKTRQTSRLWSRSHSLRYRARMRGLPST